MAFKMKAGKEGPMRKNFPAAFKKKGETIVKDGVTVEEGKTLLGRRKTTEKFTNPDPETSMNEYGSTRVTKYRKGGEKRRKAVTKDKEGNKVVYKYDKEGNLKSRKER